MIQRITYTNMPGKAALNIDPRTYTTRTRVGEGHPSHSAIPAHTPPISPSLDRLRMFLWFKVILLTELLQISCPNLFTMIYFLGR